ncbi:hypothetical protein JTE90_016887 [Oedothorax gibbosus]|uniref:Uncharacterized protein n=1 Tax=Oedothorax gibbosus TaxID=931172 RepID=A0AAV6TFW6_9ARAC|nr:hypothetical protein JTE90_016887 [Oedothorax gibbosus]
MSLAYLIRLPEAARQLLRLIWMTLKERVLVSELVIIIIIVGIIDRDRRSPNTHTGQALHVPRPSRSQGCREGTNPTIQAKPQPPGRGPDEPEEPKTP